jgi:tripartite-type tricarboxylate transporter receptor subunit TctC
MFHFLRRTKLKLINLLKSFAIVLGISASSALLPAAASQPWPARPIQIIAPIDAGTLQDTLARKLATDLSARWNQTVTVVNQPGAAGALGTKTVADSPADGYTIGLISATFTGTMATRNNLPFSRDKLTGVVKFATQEFIIFANKNAPFDNVQQMVAFARANPGKLDYATPGAGSYVNITMEHLAKTQDLQFVHVPYRNLMQAAPDVVGGRLQMMITSANSTLDGLVSKGDMKIIGGLGKTPKHKGTAIQSLSLVSPSVHANGYYGIVVPAGTPAPVVEKIHKDVIDIVSAPAFQQAVITLGGLPAPASVPGEFNRWIDDEVERLKKIIVQANVKIE